MTDDKLAERVAELEAKVKELESVVNEHHYYMTTATEDEEKKIQTASQPDSQTLSEPEVVEPVDIEWKEKKRETEEAIAADKTAREKAKKDAAKEIATANVAANKALEALRAGKPLQDGPI